MSGFSFSCGLILCENKLFLSIMDGNAFSAPELATQAKSLFHELSAGEMR